MSVRVRRVGGSRGQFDIKCGRRDTNFSCHYDLPGAGDGRWLPESKGREEGGVLLNSLVNFLMEKGRKMMTRRRGKGGWAAAWAEDSRVSALFILINKSPRRSVRSCSFYLPWSKVKMMAVAAAVSASLSFTPFAIDGCEQKCGVVSPPAVEKEKYYHLDRRTREEDDGICTAKQFYIWL